MQILTLSKNSDIIRKELQTQILNEEGILPVFEFVKQTDAYQFIALIDDIEEREKLAQGGIICFDSRPRHLDRMKLVLVGTQIITPQEKDKMNGTNMFTMREIAINGERESCDAIMAAARPWESIHIGINLNVLDASVCKQGVPGGLSTRQLLYFLHRLKMLKRPRTADILIPDGVDSRLVAKLIVELS